VSRVLDAQAEIIERKMVLAARLASALPSRASLIEFVAGDLADRLTLVTRLSHIDVLEEIAVALDTRGGVVREGR